jgi:hypothetical protein
MADDHLPTNNHWAVTIAVTAISSVTAITVAYVSKQTPPSATSATIPRDIAGNYKIVGTNPDGSSYRGTLEIVASGSGYRLIWNAGPQPYVGVGMKDENILSVGWGGNYCAVASYRIQPDGILDGKWATLNQDDIGAELLVPTGMNSNGDIAGKYIASGKNSEGIAYKEEVLFEPSGRLFRFSRSESRYIGLAFRNRNTVAVGFGPKACHVVSYKIEKNGNLTGVWGLYPGDKVGSEEAIHQ